MGTATQAISTQNQSLTNYDYSQLFIGYFKVITVTYTNGSEAAVELLPGMLFGRVSATGKGAICTNASGATTDGSSIPLGINVTKATVADGASLDIQIAITGVVNEDKIIFDTGDDLDTVYDNRRLRDRIPADTAGIELSSFKELVNYENQ